MNTAPSVRYPGVPLQLGWGGRCVALMLWGVFQVVWWRHSDTPVGVHVLAGCLVVLLCCAPWSWRSNTRSVQSARLMHLEWDGQRWSWVDRGAGDAQRQRLHLLSCQVVVDMQRWVWVKCGTASGSLWCRLSVQDAPHHWHLLRCALFAPPPSHRFATKDGVA